MTSLAKSENSRGKQVLWALLLVAFSLLLFYLLFFDPWGLHPVDGWLQARLDYHAGTMEMVSEEQGEQLWTCSMHPHILEDEPGECPVCGMALVAASGGGQEGSAKRSPAAGGEREILFYRNPMNPTISSPVPAKDEMGMDYVAGLCRRGGPGRRSGPDGQHQPGRRPEHERSDRGRRAARPESGDPHCRLPRVRPGAHGHRDHEVLRLGREGLRQLRGRAREEGPTSLRNLLSRARSDRAGAAVGHPVRQEVRQHERRGGSPGECAGRLGPRAPPILGYLFRPDSRTWRVRAKSSEPCRSWRRQVAWS